LMFRRCLGAIRDQDDRERDETHEGSNHRRDTRDATVNRQASPATTQLTLGLLLKRTRALFEVVPLRRETARRLVPELGDPSRHLPRKRTRLPSQRATRELGLCDDRLVSSELGNVEAEKFSWRRELQPHDRQAHRGRRRSSRGEPFTKLFGFRVRGWIA